MHSRRVQAEHLMRPVQESAGWDSLPPALRAGIEARAGTVTGTSPVGEGLSTSVRLILHTGSGDVFVKGTGPESMDYQRDRLQLGADLAPHLAAVSPSLLWLVQADGWNVTGWPALPGRPWADLTTSSKDIPKLTSLLADLSEIPAPAILRGTARQQWEQYSDDPAALDGNAIVHRDSNPTNFVVQPGRAWMVDFGWAIRGPAWAGAPRHAVDEYASATVREWERVMERGPLHKMWQLRASVSRSWASYREGSARF
jgi:hypothetical protein